jgi:HEAT repeat protein
VKTTLLFLAIFGLVSVQLRGQDPSADVKQRTKTIRDLAKQGSDSIPKIGPYVSDPDLSVRIEAVKALMQIGGPKTLDPLLIAARDNDPEMQIRATDGLVNVYLPGYAKTGMSGTIQRVGNSIKGKFTDTNDKVIDAYIQVQPEVIEALGKMARSGASVEARANAARAVGVLRGRAAIPDLVEALHSKDDIVMYEALMAVQKIRDPEAAPRIAFLLRDLNDRIQIAALDTTGLLRNKSAAPDVRDALAHARDIKVRRSALSALAMLSDEGDHAMFLKDLNDKDDALRAAAAEGLARLRHPDDRATMQKAFSDEHKMGPRLADAFALVAMGNLDTSEFSPLRYLFDTLNVRSYRDVSVAYLTELTREPQIRQAIYPMLTGATKDEKIQMSIVLARSGDKDSLPYLQTISTDPDTDVAQEGVRSLRSLQARLP